MGILNVTPDSFSDGGRFLNVQDSLRHALKMVEEGADIIDIGGESTRPGSESIAGSEQLRRIAPVIECLRANLPDNCLLSVDTTQGEVARAALELGIDMLNDVSAGLGDNRMLAIAAEYDVPIVLMHMQGTPKTMQDNPVYDDVVDEVATFLVHRGEAAEAVGVRRENIVIDPGIGFGKRRDDNLKLISNIDRLADSGYTVLLGASRKRFMGSICGEHHPDELLGATVATTVMGVCKGVRIFRVHDVKPNRQAADVTEALLRVREKWKAATY
jgi:dihydropteroate synthase